MGDTQLKELLQELICQEENETIEFKVGVHDPEKMGEIISALANSACYHNREYAYLVFGIDDKTKKIVGTDFHAKTEKTKGQNLNLWLRQHLNPVVDFEVFEFSYDNKHISLYKIPACKNVPVKFKNIDYFRNGSNTAKLSNYTEKERKIWSKGTIPFEKEICKSNLSPKDIINLLSIETYYNLMKLPISTNTDDIIKQFEDESFIIKTDSTYSITNLGALLLAQNINSFDGLNRRAVRVITYKGTDKINTIRENISSKGYAVELPQIIDWILTQLPANEEIGKVLRKKTTMYPEIAIRELVVNAIIHQDFSEKGFIMIEIFSDRLEITNPGIPVVDTERFIDDNKCRNEELADVMRRMRFCEEKGSGFDKIIFHIELYQLPPVNIKADNDKTTITIYSYKTLNQLNKKEKIRACYQHACLKYISNKEMTNQSLRKRFNIEECNIGIASRIIKYTLNNKLIKLNEDRTNKSKKFASYLPFWAQL